MNGAFRLSKTVWLLSQIRIHHKLLQLPGERRRTVALSRNVPFIAENPYSARRINRSRFAVAVRTPQTAIPY
ncbi:MAG: hypothetical protein FWC71_01915 [Defluviitaleaceae bacterium]|nr:hypothetical protein [Defluviitaleaceae bacterium]